MEGVLRGAGHDDATLVGQVFRTDAALWLLVGGCCPCLWCTHGEVFEYVVRDDFLMGGTFGEGDDQGVGGVWTDCQIKPILARCAAVQWQVYEN